MADRSRRFYFRPDEGMSEAEVLDRIAAWIESLEVTEARALAAALRAEVGRGQAGRMERPPER